jgi:hypothetical protein
MTSCIVVESLSISTFSNVHVCNAMTNTSLQTHYSHVDVTVCAVIVQTPVPNARNAFRHNEWKTYFYQQV